MTPGPSEAAAGSESPIPADGSTSAQAPRPAQQWGLFGPDTLTWRIHADPLFGLATLSSLLLRVLHPQGAASVLATAPRADDPWERLSWTQRHLGVITFGNSAEAAMAGARLRAVLMQVNGVTANGRQYRGDDEDLLLWWHCCQVASFVEVTRRGGLQLTEREHDTYVREQVRMAAVWGLEPEQVPASRADLTRYFRAVRPALRLTSTARTFIDAVLALPGAELAAMTQRDRPPWAAVAGLAYATLPPWAHRICGTPPATGPASLGQAATTVALHNVRDSLLADTLRGEAR